jgi:hypothetical protein
MTGYKHNELLLNFDHVNALHTDSLLPDFRCKMYSYTVSKGTDLLAVLNQQHIAKPSKIYPSILLSELLQSGALTFT